MKSHALRADILMLFTAMIWGVSFVAQRLGMDAIGPFLFTGLRFALDIPGIHRAEPVVRVKRSPPPILPAGERKIAQSVLSD